LDECKIEIQLKVSTDGDSLMLHSILTGSENYPAPYPVGFGNFFPGDKADWD
jgi:hypothetical protein